MSYLFAIILICILVWMFFGPRIKAWAQRRMMERVEDAFRARMGMPSAKEERRRRRSSAQAANDRGRRTGRDTYVKSGRKANAGSSQSMGDVIIPREYAEDVEFTEYKEFSSSTTVISEDDPATGGRKVTVESQVSDVEYVEIKGK